jgi:hypothetical protein
LKDLECVEGRSPIPDFALQFRRRGKPQSRASRAVRVVDCKTSTGDLHFSLNHMQEFLPGEDSYLLSSLSCVY